MDNDKLSLAAAKTLVKANFNKYEEHLLENDEESYGYTSFAASLLSANEYWQDIKNIIISNDEKYKNNKDENYKNYYKDYENYKNYKSDEIEKVNEELKGEDNDLPSSNFTNITEKGNNSTTSQTEKKPEETNTPTGQIEKKPEETNNPTGQTEKKPEETNNSPSQKDISDNSEEENEDEDDSGFDDFFDDKKDKDNENGVFDDGNGVFDDGNGVFDDGSEEFDNENGVFDDGSEGFDDENGVLDDGSEGFDNENGELDDGNEKLDDESEKLDDESEKLDDESEKLDDESGEFDDESLDEEDEDEKDEIGDEDDGDEIEDDTEDEEEKESLKDKLKRKKESLKEKFGSLKEKLKEKKESIEKKVKEKKESIKEKFSKKDDENKTGVEKKIDEGKKIENISGALGAARDIMKKPDGIYGEEDRNTIISTLDILMKNQDNKSSEEKKEEKGFLGKFKSKLNRTQTSSKLNPSIKRLKSKLQSLYEEYPPLKEAKKMPSTSMPDELRNNENIMNFAIKADFLNDAEKLIRDTLSEIYILEKNSLGEDATASAFSDQGKNAIVVLSTLLRQQNQVDGGSERNTYNYQYKLMRRVLAMKKESSSYSYGSSRKGNSKQASFEKNIPAMRVLGIALKRIIVSINNKGSDPNDAKKISKIKEFAKKFAADVGTDIENSLQDGLKQFVNNILTNFLTSGKDYAINFFGTSFKNDLLKFLKNPTQQNASNLLEACLKGIENDNYGASYCMKILYNNTSSYFDKILRDEQPLRELFYKNDDDSANNKQPKTEPAKPTQKEDTKNKK